MMVSPEWYAEEYLEGKTPEEILAEIKKLEREVRRLRRAIADPNYKNRAEMICPDEEVQLQMNKEYLKMAKRILKLRQQYMDSLEYNEGMQPLPDCGGIQPPSILLPTDKEE